MSRSCDHRPSPHRCVLPAPRVSDLAARRHDRPAPRTAVLAGVAALLLGAIVPAFAQTAITWSSASDTAFSTGANWTGGTAPADSLTTNSVTFDGTGTANPVLSTSQSLQGLSFTGGSYTLSATGGAALTLGTGGVTTTAGTHTISTALVLGTDQSWSPGSGLQLTVSGVISGSGAALTKTGAGTLVLSGANTYSGATTVTAGTLLLSGAGNNNSSDITLANSANLTFTAADQRGFTKTITGTAGNVTFNVAGNTSGSGGGDPTRFSLGNSGAFTGTVVINTGLVAPTADAAFGDTANVIQLNAGSGTSAGLAATAALTLPSTRSIQLTTAGGDGIFRAYGGLTFQIDGVISGAGNLVKTDGGTLVLTGANTYTGTTTVSWGTLQLGAGSTTGSVAGNIVNNALLIFYRSDALTYAGVISGSGTFTKAGSGTLTLSGANTYTGGTTISDGTLQLGAGGTTGWVAGDIVNNTNNSTLSFNRTDNVTYSGIISGPGNLTQAGTGTLTLSGANTFTGATTISAGTLELGHALALQNSPLNTAGAGVLSLSSVTTPTFGGLTGSTDLGSFITTGYDSVTALTLNPASGAALTYSGVIADGATGMTLTKTGAGTQILSGASTFTGTTTVSGGILQFAKPTALYSNSTASWTAANIIVNSGGTLALNVGGTGEFTTANVTTLLTNLSTVSNNGLRSGSTLGFDTTNAGGTFTLADTIANSTGTGGGAVGVIKLGTGTLVLSAANTYTGATTVSAGTLQLDNALALQVSALNTSGAGALSLPSVTTPTFGGLTGSTNLASVITTGYGAVTSLTLNPSSGAAYTYSGVIADGAAGMTLTKTGAGTQILTGSSTFTGGTTISAGTLQIGAGIAGSIIGNITNNAALVFNRSNALSYAGVISGSGTLTKTGSGTLTLTGASTFTDTTTISAGTLQIGNASTTGSVAGNIVNNAALVFSRSNALSYAGVISGSGTLKQAGAGTLTLSGANTFTGKTTISAGTLSINSLADRGTASALGTPTTVGNGTIAIGSLSTSGTLIYTGPAASTDRVIDLAGTTGGATLNGSGTGPLTFTSSFTATGAAAKTLTLAGTAAGNTIAGAIVNNSSANRTSINQTGSGSWILSGSNAYTGTTTVSAGILQFAKPAALYGGITGNWTAANIRVISGATLALNVGGTGEFTTGNVTTLLANLSAINNTGLRSGSTLGFDTTNASGGIFTLANTIANSTGNGSGAVGVSKLGTGTLVLSGASTYTGATTVNAGTLSVNGSLAAGSTVTVASGGTLGGSGTINGATTVASGGTLAPGNSPGLLTFGGSLTLNSGATSVFEINGTSRGTTFDAVNVTGLTTYGGTLTLSFGSTLAEGTTLNLFGLTGGSAGALSYVTATGSYAGSFAGSGGSWTLTNGSQLLTFTESTGNLVVGASAIPEPGTCAAFAGAAALGIALWRRWRAV